MVTGKGQPALLKRRTAGVVVEVAEGLSVVSFQLTDY